MTSSSRPGRRGFLLGFIVFLGAAGSAANFELYTSEQPPWAVNNLIPYKLGSVPVDRSDDHYRPAKILPWMIAGPTVLALGFGVTLMMVGLKEMTRRDPG